MRAAFFRIKAKAGAKKAVIAVAHKLVVIAYSILKTKEPYRELGGDYFDKLNPERTAHRLMVRIAKLGFEVEIKRRPVPAVAPGGNLNPEASTS